MADLETLATPGPASSSKKEKHSKKHKAIDDEAADASPISSPKKKHSKKNREAIDGDDSPVSSPKKKHSKKKRKPIDVTVDASLAAGPAAPAAAPVVAYFPSGYDPLAAAGSKGPRARVFRHPNHANRVDLVVRSPGGGPDFVGDSYTGEAAAPSLCSYALGVLDKATGTLKVVPIAANKILRMEPRLEVQKPAHSQHSEVTSETGSAVEAGEKKIQDLTDMFGSKKDKDKDNKWRLLIQQRDDPSAYVDLDLGNPTNVNASDDQVPVIQNIPPYDPTADTSEKAYVFDEIIPKSIRPLLLDIVDHVESGEFQSKGYGKFVSNRVKKLEELQGKDKEKLAWILSYITHLLYLLTRNSSMFKHRRMEMKATNGPGVPEVVYRKLLRMFTEEGSTSLPTEKHELLINYILVLTLFADDFRSDPEDICADLKMTRVMVRPYYDQLGCKSVSAGAFQQSFMTLPAPLKFPQQVARRKQRQRR